RGTDLPGGRRALHAHARQRLRRALRPARPGLRCRSVVGGARVLTPAWVPGLGDGHPPARPATPTCPRPLRKRGVACLTLSTTRRPVMCRPSCCKPSNDGAGIAAVAVIAAAAFVSARIGPAVARIWHIAVEALTIFTLTAAAAAGVILVTWATAH